ncbi:hypothetical protein Plhal703r1_c09g0046991 [Plasmopara halstedii]
MKHVDISVHFIRDHGKNINIKVAMYRQRINRLSSRLMLCRHHYLLNFVVAQYDRVKSVPFWSASR